jgi:DNA-binding NarL/FixJ family response regulator
MSHPATEPQPLAERRAQPVVLVLELDRLVGECAARFLRNAGGLGEVIVTQCATEAVELAHRHAPEAVIVGTCDPDAGPIEDRLRSASPLSALVLFAIVLDHESVSRAVGAGYAGIVARRDGRPEELLVAVRAGVQGVSHFSHEAMSVLARASPRRGVPEPVLSVREVEVMAVMLAGKSTEEIAASLYISRHTVRNHVRNILGKLGARSKLEAVVRATQLGLIGVDSDGALTMSLARSWHA